MSKYINLEDPDVHYTQNYGPAEGYIIGSEVERIDIVRCGECRHNSLKRVSGNVFCALGHAFSQLYDYCSDGERRADG